MKKTVLKTVKTWLHVAKKPLVYFYSLEKDSMREISESEYKQIFLKDRTAEQVKKSYEQAWQAKNFENENYWKRANYFWLFQAASFTGYFAVLGTNAYTIKPVSAYLVACAGFITALAWHLTNKGSKTWQRHWEIHVDMLEDTITGPLYKIVTENKTYSVSKINEIVSNFFRLIWFLVMIEYLLSHNFHFDLHPSRWDLPVTLITFFTLYSIGAMYNGHGRGRFGTRRVRFYQRWPTDYSSGIAS